MRIISGKNKGRIIQPPKNFKSRPTTDFAKESLFNLINNEYYIEDLDVLDLFAGTGSISLEFASRGAGSVTAVEKIFSYANHIKKLSEKLKLTIKVINDDFYKFVNYHKIQYDLIFADPPYNLEERKNIPYLIFEKNLLKKNGTLIVEHSSDDDYRTFPYYEKTRTYGKVNFTFFYYV
ncbi:MAG: RsmD family RNA methyltransferase [Marinilabiliales bacterium]